MAQKAMSSASLAYSDMTLKKEGIEIIIFSLPCSIVIKSQRALNYGVHLGDSRGSTTRFIYTRKKLNLVRCIRIITPGCPCLENSERQPTVNINYFIYFVNTSIPYFIF